MKTLIGLCLPLLLATAADLRLGKPLQVDHPISIAALLEKPADYTGKTVQVKGKITEVCQMAGCWMNLTDGDKMVRIKVKDGDIEFPKDSAGKMAIAEGTFTKIEMTKEQAIAQAKHEAEEAGKKFNAAAVTSGKTIYQITGSGAVILSN